MGFQDTHGLGRMLCLALLAAAWVSFARVAEAAPAGGETKKRSILFVCDYWDSNVPYRLRFFEQRLNEQGYETCLTSFKDLSDATMRKFNLIMFLDFPGILEGVGDQIGQTSAAYQDGLAQRLEPYVNDGGGLIFFSIGPVNGAAGAVAQNRLLKRWGAEYLMEWQVVVTGRPSARTQATRFPTQPTAASGEIGGYVSPPVPPKSAPQPIDWRGMGFAPAPPKVFSGIIGAHTAYSDGKGTVQEYAAAAKSAGLDYLVFTEQFTDMTPQKWKLLREDCRTASDDTFLALAGYEYRVDVPSVGKQKMKWRLANRRR